MAIISLFSDLHTHLASPFSLLHFPETVSTNIFLRCEGSDCTFSGTGRALVTIESSDEQIGQLVAKGQIFMLNLFGFIGICCLKEISRRSSCGSVGWCVAFRVRVLRFDPQ